ncbi:hypothetical protein, partial [Roseiflexus castenholzii]|uniref:hypothetical protein n=1 Tax=Roseiflexus castenholzii TaxID=120962 RepID=UPI003C7E62EE
RPARPTRVRRLVACAHGMKRGRVGDGLLPRDRGARADRRMERLGRRPNGGGGSGGCTRQGAAYGSRGE